MVVFGNSLTNSVNGILLIISPLSASFPVTVGSLSSGVSFVAIVPLTQSFNQTLRFGSNAASNKVMHDMGMKKRTRITYRLSCERSSAQRTVTVLDLTSMYVSRMRHILDKGAIRWKGVTQIHYHSLERRDKDFNEIERSGVHEFVRRPDQTNGFVR